MFPEGTDRTDHTLRRSRDFAKKNGLKELKNVLYPRSLGFVHMVNEMKSSKFIVSKRLSFALENYIRYVYDITVAYPKEIVQNETDMILKGRLARTVHYDICRYDIEELPKTDSGLNKWLLW
jgi:lysocardiolipin and lysophospholipid acyltransferase